jgi:hypothetical protein
MSTLDTFLTPSERPVKVREAVVPNIIVDGDAFVDTKRINPYAAPTYEKFQSAFKSKYLRMPRATEIEQWYLEHPGEWERRHGKKGAKR